MTCLRCTAERVSTGSSRVLPALRKKIPLGKIKPRFRVLIMPGIILGAAFLAFRDPRLMWVLTPLWLVAAYRLGFTAHAHPEDAEASNYDQPA